MTELAKIFWQDSAILAAELHKDFSEMEGPSRDRAVWWSQAAAGCHGCERHPGHSEGNPGVLGLYAYSPKPVVPGGFHGSTTGPKSS